MRNARSLFVALSLITLVACAESSPVLPPGVGPDYDVPDELKDDDGDGDGNGQGNGSGKNNPTAASCDDPSTCEYDLETTCGGQPVIDPASLPNCPESVCASGGHCVPSGLVPADQKGDLAECAGDALCVPDRLIERGGLATAPSCAAFGGGEGRCLSTCLPAVAYKAALLSRDVCAADELCVPCFDPFDGTDTGACAISCDSGPTQPAKTLPSCCSDKGGGTCVPSTFAGEGADKLDEEECEGLGALGSVCVPSQILDAHLVGVPFNPVECETGAFIQSLGLGSEGGCLPECIPIVDALPVSQSNCSDGFKCVPCVDLDGDGTGACTNL